MMIVDPEISFTLQGQGPSAMLCEGIEHLQKPYEFDTSRRRWMNKASYVVEEAYSRLDVNLLLKS